MKQQTESKQPPYKTTNQLKENEVLFHTRGALNCICFECQNFTQVQKNPEKFTKASVTTVCDTQRNKHRFFKR